MKLKITLLLFFMAIAFQGQAQEKTNATYVGTVGSVIHVPSIASQSNLAPARVKKEVMEDGRASKNIVVPGKDPQTEDDYFVRNPNPLEQKINGRAPLLVFDAASSSSQPTDPAIGVGPNHAVVVFNTGFRIFDKSGNPLTGQISPNPTIFPNGGCCDLTISYDNAADRFVMTFLGSGAQIAISDGPDPVNDGWYVYTIPQINDYQKLSVWSDGYYITENTGATNRIYALERAKMLIGDPTAQIIGFPLPGIITSGFYSPQALNVTNNNLPAAGGLPIVYLQDDAWSGVSQDHFKLWTVDVDWSSPGSSTISAPTEFITTPFISVFDGGSFSNLAQPGGGPDIDALQATIMNQAQFRKFSDHNSAIFNFVVDTDASGGELAGIRWFELRQSGDNQPWSIFQEGTYTSPDGKHAWHASMMMDVQGNIGMGYTGMAGPTTPDPTSKRVSSYYTGRFANDPLNTMTVAEELIAAGNQNIPGLRYGDYSKIDLDPSNDKQFWFINEYINSGRKDVVGVFQIAPNFNLDAGVVDITAPVSGVLSNSEQITITIFNYGEDDISNFDVTYQIDGGATVTETFTGTITSASTASYTFSQTADLSVEGQTYSITTSTMLSGDEENSNDSFTKEVTHIFANDIGVTEVTAPVSGEGLGSEAVTVTINNFGTATQSNFNVAYSINGGTPVIENVAGPVNGGESISYTFTTLGDFSTPGSYRLNSTTVLTGDSDLSNNTLEVTVVNFECASESNNNVLPIGPGAGTLTESIISFTDDSFINDVNITLDIVHTYDGDLTIKLRSPAGTEVVLADNVGGSGDNFTNTTFDDQAALSIQDGSPPFTGTFRPQGSLSDFEGESTLGDWTLSILDNANGDGGTLNSWSLELCGAEPLGLPENYTESSDLLVLNKGNNQFEVQLLTTDITDRLTFTVTNMLGQTLVSYKIDNNGTGYYYNLDMSYVSAGVYFVRLGNKNVSKVKRILVN